MTLFVILSIVLVAATLAILAWRGPVVAHVTDPATAAAAVADYRKALALRPNDANLLADLADMLAAVGNGSLDGEPIQLVDKALAIDPNHVKALALKGSYAMTQRDFRTALGAWNQALKVAQPDDPIARFLRGQLDDMREMASRAAAEASAPGSGQR